MQNWEIVIMHFTKLAQLLKKYIGLGSQYGKIICHSDIIIINFDKCQSRAENNESNKLSFSSTE